MKPTVAIYGIKDRNLYENPGFTHDHNLCIMENGQVIQYLHLERYTRRKYDNRLDEFIEHLVSDKTIDLPPDFDFVSVNSFVGSAFLSKNGRFRFEAAPNKRLTTPLQPANCWIETEHWQGKKVKAYNMSQEWAHIFSNLPFCSDLKDNSLLIHFDGGASLSNFSAFWYRKKQIQKIEAHWKLAHLSKFFNDNALTFAILGAQPGEHCSVAGKLMGYAALGTYKTEIAQWLKTNRYFKDIWKTPNVFFESVQKKFGIFLNDFDTRNPFLQDVAAVFQVEFEKQLLAKITELKHKTQATYLYYSGGCALNIIANTQIVQNNLFEEVFIPPCCNDSGLSLGAAAFLEWQKHGKIELHSPYLNNVGLAQSTSNPTVETIKQVAKLLLEHKIIGICNDFGEIGPRALGNRSIIALANCDKLSQKVSMDCKKREWFRPIAPIMLLKNAEIVTEQKVLHHLSRFMLLDFKIKPSYQADLKGVMHQNQTARIQTLAFESENPFMYRLLSHLDESFGIKALINTSFNSQEPIVHTHKQAFASAQKMNLDAVLMNHQLTIL